LTLEGRRAKSKGERAIRGEGEKKAQVPTVRSPPKSVGYAEGSRIPGRENDSAGNELETVGDRENEKSVVLRKGKWRKRGIMRIREARMIGMSNGGSGDTHTEKEGLSRFCLDSGLSGTEL